MNIQIGRFNGWHVIAALVLTLLVNGRSMADHAEAKRWMTRATEASGEIENKSQASHAAAEFARVYARLGDVEAAFAAAKRVADPQIKLYALASTAQAAVDAGESTAVIVDEAKTTLSGNEGPFTKSAMERILIIARGKPNAPAVDPTVENADESLEKLQLTFSTAANRGEKFGAFETLTSRLLRLQQYSELGTVIEAMVKFIKAQPLPDQSSKFGVYGDAAAIARVRGLHLNVASAFADEEKFAEATEQFELVDPLIDDLPEAAALVKWQLQEMRIRVLLQLGREGDAITQMKKIKSPLIASRAASMIAVRKIESGEVEVGLQIAEQIDQSHGSGDARGEVAIALLQHADPQQAGKYLNQLGESDDAMSGIHGIARHWVETKDERKLLATFNSLKSPVAKTNYAIAAAEFLILNAAKTR